MLNKFKLNEDRFIQLVEDDIRSDANAKDPRHSDKKKWYELYFGTIADSNKETDRFDSYKFDEHIPMIGMACDAIHPRLTAWYSSAQPFIKLSPTREIDVKNVKKTQLFENWALLNNTPSFKKSFDESGLILIIEGENILYIDWSEVRRKQVNKYWYNAFIPNQDGSIREVSYDEILSDLFDKYNLKRRISTTFVKDDQSQVEVVYEYKQDVNVWIESKASVIFELDLPKPIEQIEKGSDEEHNLKICVRVESTEFTFQGVKMFNINSDNIFFPKDVESLQPGDCPHVIYFSEKSWSSIEKGIKNKEYTLSPSDLEVIRKYFKEISKSNTYTLKKGEDDAYTEGVIKKSIREFENQDTQIFPSAICKVYECFYSYDVDDDLIDEEIVVTILEVNEKKYILQKCYLEEKYPHGMRPFVMGVYDLIPFSAHGRGVPQKMLSLNRLYDDLWNIFLSCSTAKALPFFFYRSGPGTLIPQTYKIKPLEGIPIGSSEITFPNFQNNQPIQITELAAVKELIEKRSNVTPGLQGLQQGSRQTAMATFRLISESLEGLSQNHNRFKEFWCEACLHFHLLYKFNMPEKMKFWYDIIDKDITETKFEEMSRIEIIDHPSIDLSMQIERTVADFERQLAEHLFDKFVNNPILIQSGLVQKTQIYSNAENLLHAYNKKNVSDYIVKPPEAEQPVLNPDIENRMMASGYYVNPNPNENIQEHIASHINFIEQNKMNLSPASKNLLYDHIKKTNQNAQDMAQMMLLAQSAMKTQNLGAQESGGGIQGNTGLGTDINPGLTNPDKIFGNALAGSNQNQPGINTTTGA